MPDISKLPPNIPMPNFNATNNLEEIGSIVERGKHDARVREEIFNTPRLYNMLCATDLTTLGKPRNNLATAQHILDTPSLREKLEASHLASLCKHHSTVALQILERPHLFSPLDLVNKQRIACYQESATLALIRQTPPSHFFARQWSAIARQWPNCAREMLNTPAIKNRLSENQIVYRGFLRRHQNILTEVEHDQLVRLDSLETGLRRNLFTFGRAAREERQRQQLRDVDDNNAIARSPSFRF